MTILTSGRELPSMKGSFLQPQSALPEQWSTLKELEDVVLVLTEGASSAALAFKVWPELKLSVRRIVYAGGTLKRGDATPYAEASVYREPEALESLLNTGVPVAVCTAEAAEARGMSAAELAGAYAVRPGDFASLSCGIHVETQRDSAAYGSLVCDRLSNRKFDRENACLVV